MADATTKKLVGLLQPEHPTEVRCAAAVVLGALGARDRDVARALCAGLDDPEPALRAQVVAATAKLRVEGALPLLLERVREGGPESEMAARAAACLGARGAGALQKLMGQVAPGLRRRIAGALGTGNTASAETAAVDAFLDSDPGVVDAATRSLISRVPSLSGHHRRALADHVLSLLKPNKKRQLAPASETALVRLLAAVGDIRAEAAFWERTRAPHPPELRGAALQALGTLPPPSDFERVKQLLVSAVDPDFRVAAPSLMILKQVPVKDPALKDWITLLTGPDPAARRLALEKLADKDKPGVASALCLQLDHPDRGLRDQALACLCRLKQGRKALAKVLLEAGSPDLAWTVARALAKDCLEEAGAARPQLLSRACAYLESGDRRADPLMFLLKELAPGKLNALLAKRALDLRKKKQYGQALVYWRLLTRDTDCPEPYRFESAGCALKLSRKDLSLEARGADPSLQQVAGLIHREEKAFFGWLQKARWLDDESLYYLGFHLVEGNREEKGLGGKLLQLVVKRVPRTQLAKDARTKLRSQGL